MKLYAFSAPDIPKHAGYLKIGETNGSVEERVKQQGHELNVEKPIVWQDAVITERIGIDKMVRRYLKEQGFHVQQFGTGWDAEWVKCTVDDLIKAFEIIKQRLYDEEKQREEVGNQFYLEIRNWYYWTIGTNKIDSEYALRLIVRLFFCYFLQEKDELVPKELFDERFVRNHLKGDEEYSYYNAILRNVFFHCLNTPMANRHRIKLEHEKLIKNVPKIKEQFDKIPFLNGGIFNEHEGDEIPLNNDYFFSEKRTRHIPELGNGCEVSGIIRILSRYNYKLSLDDLLDHASYARTIDPEFIGKVFESLLACIDTDSLDTRRKITGSYYTPREIVDYMVCEALDTYLEQSRNRKIAQEQSQSYDCGSETLLQCKILDPACGSGAFPCGIMNEMMRRLDPHRTLSQLDRYHRKLDILRNVIYGVDIQSIAVQISQLRLFLSLIQEIVPDKRNPNYGIEPLPNLETKFVCADALIGLKNGRQRQLEVPIVREASKKLLDIRTRYFLESDVQRKLMYRQDDESLRKILGIALQDAGALTHDTAEKLIAWNPYDQSLSSPFFDPEWMFGVEKFDVVIGNPPYVEAKKLKTVAAKLRGHYKVYSGTADLSVFFIERGLQLCKQDGLVLYITTNKFFNTEYGKFVRSHLLRHQIRTILNFEQVALFASSLVSCVILGVVNAPVTSDSFRYRKFYRLNKAETQKLFPDAIKIHDTYKQSLLGDKEWSFADAGSLALKKKIETVGKRIDDIKCISVFRGVTTGYNPAFIIDQQKRAELIQKESKSKNIIKPLLQGRNIRKWQYNTSDNFLLLTGYKVDVKKRYPAIFKHLNVFKKKLVARDDQGINWWNLRACTYYSHFEQEKIIWGLTADKWAFAYDAEGHYLPSNAYMLTSGIVPIKYLLGILNSRLLRYYFGFIGVMTAGGAYTLKHATIQQLPIVVAKNPQPIISLVEEVLLLCAKGKDVSDLEQRIDALVYELYGLTDEEIKIVEQSTG